jgi:hypothetical protein
MQATPPDVDARIMKRLIVISLVAATVCVASVFAFGYFGRIDVPLSSDVEIAPGRTATLTLRLNNRAYPPGLTASVEVDALRTDFQSIVRRAGGCPGGTSYHTHNYNEFKGWVPQKDGTALGSYKVRIRTFGGTDFPPIRFQTGTVDGRVRIVLVPSIDTVKSSLIITARRPTYTVEDDSGINDFLASLDLGRFSSAVSKAIEQRLPGANNRVSDLFTSIKNPSVRRFAESNFSFDSARFETVSDKTHLVITGRPSSRFSAGLAFIYFKLFA